MYNYSITQKQAKLFSSTEFKVFLQTLYKYIDGVVQNDKHKILAINEMPDHMHLFVGLNPAISILHQVKDAKQLSNKRVNANRFTNTKFSWQDADGSCSYRK